METEISVMFYIGLKQKDGSTLFYNEMNRNWSIFRRDAMGWVSESVAGSRLESNITRSNVPQNAEVVGIRTTIEEVK